VIRLTRIFGFLMIAAGAVVILTWLFAPLRFVWGLLLKLPLPIQVGLGAALFGLLLLLGSLIWERMEERKEDRELGDEDYGLHRPEEKEKRP